MRVFIAMCAIVLVSYASIFAGKFDGRREGLIFGLGISARLTSFNVPSPETYHGPVPFRQKRYGIVSVCTRIGQGYGERFMFTLDADLGLVVAESIRDDRAQMDGSFGPSFYYLFKGTVPSAYVRAAPSLFVISNAYEDWPTEGLAGIKYTVAAGIEPRKHFLLEIAFSYLHAFDTRGYFSYEPDFKYHVYRPAPWQIGIGFGLLDY